MVLCHIDGICKAWVFAIVLNLSISLLTSALTAILLSHKSVICSPSIVVTTEPYIMYVWNSFSGTKIHNNFSFSITLWPVGCFCCCRTQWELFSYNLCCFVSPYCKLCSHRFYWGPCLFNSLDMQSSIFIPGFLTSISVVKLHPYNTRWFVWLM